MNAAILTAETLQLKAEARRDDKLRQVELLKSKLETAEPRRVTQLQSALSKATAELATLNDKAAAAKLHSDMVRKSNHSRASKRVHQLQLRLKIVQQKAEILSLQERSLKDEIAHLKGQA